MNVGPNRGRRLRGALSRFAAMLIEEAHDITGFSYERLDEELGLPDGQSKRYSLYPMRGKTRAPQAASIQQLENRVAQLLNRSAHIVVVENNAKLNLGDVYGTDHVEGKPADNLNLREFDSSYFQLGYDGDWPTYGRLKYNPMDLCNTFTPIHELLRHDAHDEWPEMLRIYAWQWGVLWGHGLPWLTCEAFGASPGTSIDLLRVELTEQAKRARITIGRLSATSEGRELLSIAEMYLLAESEETPPDSDVEQPDLYSLNLQSVGMM